MTDIHICDENCNEHKRFFNYHVHSVFSARDCINTIDDLYSLSKQFGQDIGITDHGNIGAWVSSYKTAKKHGMKWIPGCEFYIHPKRNRLFEIRKELSVLDKLEIPASKDEKKKITEKRKELNFELNDMLKYHHIVAMAKNTEGMYELMEIHNRAYRDWFYYKPITAYEDFFNTKVNKDGSRNIILTTACLASTSSQYILNDNEDRAESHILDLHEYYKQDLYIELQANGMKEQKKVNTALIRIAKENKLKLTIANDAHYPKPEYGDTHQLLLLIQGNNTIDDLGQTVWAITHENKKGEIRRSKAEKVGGMFQDIPFEQIKIGDYIQKKSNKTLKGVKTLIEPKIITDEVLKDPKKSWDFKILDINEVSKAWIIEADNLVYGDKEELKNKSADHPEITSDVFDFCVSNNIEIGSKIETIELNTENKLPRIDNEDEVLYKMCMDKLVQMGEDKNEAYVKRFNYEYKVITKGGFASYFLILADIHRFCVENDLPKGIGRGSSASSLLAFLLGITLVDPLKQANSSLFDFRRFLNPARVGAEIATFYTANGRKYQLFLDDEVIVLRDNKEVKIMVSELNVDDEFVREA